MKKFLILTAVSVLAIQLPAQDLIVNSFGDTISCQIITQTVKKQNANEIRLNLITTLYWTPEISYERVKTADLGGFAKSDYFGYGVAACVTLMEPYSPRRIYETNFQIVPYFRLYFSSDNSFFYNHRYRYPGLIFIEPNAAIVGYGDGIKFCFGFALGRKLINIMDYTAEIYVGGGGNFKKDDVSYWRIGINIGKRWSRNSVNMFE